MIREHLMRIIKKKKVEEKKGVVYEIPCQMCEKVTETGRTLAKKIQEHKICSFIHELAIARHS